MKTRLTLKAGQKGTKRLSEVYGDTLLYVRYRYDENTRERLKTVELVIERSGWEPPPQRFTPDTKVALLIAGYELKARTLAKSAGALWDPVKRLWFVTYGNIAASQLERHIHVDETSCENKTIL